MYKNYTYLHRERLMLQNIILFQDWGEGQTARSGMTNLATLRLVDSQPWNPPRILELRSTAEVDKVGHSHPRLSKLGLLL